MSDAQVGRILIIALATIISAWTVSNLSWEKKVDRFLLKAGAFMIIIRGIFWLVFDVLGLFPLD